MNEDIVPFKQPTPKTFFEHNEQERRTFFQDFETYFQGKILQLTIQLFLETFQFQGTQEAYARYLYHFAEQQTDHWLIQNNITLPPSNNQTGIRHELIIHLVRIIQQQTKSPDSVPADKVIALQSGQTHSKVAKLLEHRLNHPHFDSSPK